ncbi:MAG: amidohydrolase, partial [Thermoanaerobaculia bacterium]
MIYQVKGARVLAAAVGFAVAGGLVASVAGTKAVGATKPAGETTITVTQGTGMAVALSPDGRTLAIDLLGALWTLPATGGEARRLTDEEGDSRLPQWSPDGRRIVFQSYRDGNWHLWTVTPAGTDLRQLTFGPFDDREPQGSPDGRRLVFSSDRGGSYDLWQLEPETGALTQLTSDPGEEFMPAWSPDGREIAFITSGPPASRWGDAPASSHLRVLSAGRQRLLAELPGTAGAPAWSPDGKTILVSAVSGGDSRLLEIAVPPPNPGPDPGPVEPRPVSSPGEDVFPFRVAWRSPGDFLYTADGQIKRRAEGLGAPQVIAFRAAVALHRPPYAPRRRDLDDPAPQPVRGILTPVISPAGDAVAFVALGDLWLQTKGGEPQRLTDDAFAELDPAWSRDGSRLAFACDRAGTLDIWVRDLATGEDRRLTDLPGTESAPAWSPDGSHVAFLTGEGELWTVDVATGKSARLHPPLLMPGRPSWSADGKTIALSALQSYSSRFREGRNEILLVPAAGGEPRRANPLPHRSIGSRGSDGPVWSPDGGSMAFVTEGAVWIAPVSAQGEVLPAYRVADELASTLSWTGDSRELVYQTAAGLKRLRLADGRSAEIPIALRWQRRLPKGDLVIHAGRLFDGRSATPRLDVDVVVRGHRIAEIVPHRPGAHRGQLVDAAGATVLPGLIDMHTHQDPHFGEALGRIWLAYGVTAVREPATDPYEALERREAYASGARRGPRIFFTGPSFDGGRIYYARALAMQAGPAVTAELERARQLGYDLIKTYVRLPDALQKRVIDEAHRQGIPVTSHELYPAVAFGADGVEHLSSVDRRGYPIKTSSLNRSYEDVVQLLSRSGVTLTPTLGIAGGFDIAVARDPSLLEDRRFKTLFPPWVVGSANGRMTAARRNL